MALHLIEDTFDLGVTTIENLFIDEFLPFADALSIKVYLTAMRLLMNKRDVLTMEDVARRIERTPEEVQEAFEYWASQGLVTLDGEDVTFKSLRNIYLNENFERKSTQTSYDLGDHYQDLFHAINSVLYIPLGDTEREHFVSFYQGKTIDQDMILLAFDESKNSKYRVKKAIELLRFWLENQLKTLEDVLAFKERFNHRQKQYKDILSALGRPYDAPTIADKESIDSWLDVYHFSMDEIIQKIKEVTMNKTKPSMNYLNKVFENIQRETSRDDEKEKGSFSDFFRERL